MKDTWNAQLLRAFESYTREEGAHTAIVDAMDELPQVLQMIFPVTDDDERGLLVEFACESAVDEEDEPDEFDDEEDLIQRNWQMRFVTTLGHGIPASVERELYDAVEYVNNFIPIGAFFICEDENPQHLKLLLKYCFILEESDLFEIIDEISAILQMNLYCASATLPGFLGIASGSLTFAQAKQMLFTPDIFDDDDEQDG